MRRALTRSLPLLGALGLIGCGLQLNGANEDAPRLSAQLQPYNSYSDSVLFSWWYPPANASGFSLQLQTATGQFTTALHLDGDAQTAHLDLGLDDPFGALVYRIVAEPSGSTSSIVTLARPLPPPQELSAEMAPDGFQVVFNKFSSSVVPIPQSASNIILSRRVVPAAGSPGAWMVLDTEQASLNTFLDADLSGWVDDAHYDYQAVVQSGSLVSSPLSVSTSAAPFLPLTVLSADPTAAGAHLVFVWSSKAGGAISITRTRENSNDPELIATVTATGAAQSYDDAISPGLVAYDFAIVGDTSDAPPIRRWVLAGMPQTPGLQSSIVRLPTGLVAARTRGGSFAVLAHLNLPSPVGPSVALIPAGDDGTHAFALPFDYGAQMSVVLDAESHPHAVYGSAGGVEHAWYDGQLWQSELVAANQEVVVLLAFGFGADGTLHAAWNNYSGYPVASRVNGSWVIDDGPTASRLSSAVLVSGDALGRPHLILNDQQAVLQHYWLVAGQWQQDAVPIPQIPGSASTLGSPQFFLAGGSQLTLIQQVSDNPRYQVVMDWTSAGWTSRDLVPNVTPVFVEPTPYRAGLSADGQHLAVASFTGDLTIYDQTTANVLHWSKNMAGEDRTAYAAGIDANNKAWVLDFTDVDSYATPGTIGSAVLYQEP